MGILDSVKKAAANKLKTAAKSSAKSASAIAKASAKAAALVGSKAKLSSSEVAAIIEKKVRAKGKSLNWKTSVVDLMAALGMNSSADSRKKLAAKLNYSGSAADGSAEKNNWLHAELLKAFAKNGGKVPSNLL